MSVLWLLLIAEPYGPWRPAEPMPANRWAWDRSLDGQNSLPAALKASAFSSSSCEVSAAAADSAAEGVKLSKSKCKRLCESVFVSLNSGVMLEMLVT